MASESKLTPFEWSMIEGAQQVPMTFVIRLIFTGSFDSALFEKAVHCAVKLHPLLRSQVKSRATAIDYHWVPAETSKTQIDIANAGVQMENRRHGYIDLQQETGIRIWVRHNAEQIDMRFQFHHACCDGIGAYRFIEDILSFYDSHVKGTNPESNLRTLDPQALAQRTPRPEKQLTAFQRVCRVSYVQSSRVFRLFIERPASIWTDPGSDPSNSRDSLLPEMPSYTFDKKTTKSLRQLANSKRATLYELLLRDLVLAIRDWNADHGHGKKSLLRFMIPISLRTNMHDEMPAANCVSMAYMTFKRQVLNDADSLMQSINRQLAYIRKWQLEYSWHQVAALISSNRVLSWMATRRRRRHCFATSVLSNMGRIFGRSMLPRSDGKICCGDLTLQAAESAPPVNAFTPAVFGCHLYAGQLTLTMNFNPAQMNQTEANQLLQIWIDHLQNTVNLAEAKTRQL